MVILLFFVTMSDSAAGVNRPAKMRHWLFYKDTQGGIFLLSDGYKILLIVEQKGLEAVCWGYLKLFEKWWESPLYTY